MYSYVNEIRTVQVDCKRVGFIARRVVTMGVHDYGNRWSYATSDKIGHLKFRGSFSSRKEATEALVKYVSVKESV